MSHLTHCACSTLDQFRICHLIIFLSLYNKNRKKRHTFTLSVNIQSEIPSTKLTLLPQIPWVIRTRFYMKKTYLFLMIINIFVLNGDIYCQQARRMSRPSLWLKEPAATGCYHVHFTCRYRAAECVRRLTARIVKGESCLGPLRGCSKFFLPSYFAVGYR